MNQEIVLCHGDTRCARLILGNKAYLSGGKGKVNRNGSLGIDSLCNQAGGRNMAVACFIKYFEFAGQKE